MDCQHQLQRSAVDLHYEIATKQIYTRNSIASLAQHIHYYIAGIKNVFEGGTLDIKDKYSFHFAPIVSQMAWNSFLDNFWNDSEEFALLIEQMPEVKLKESFVDEKYGDYQRNIYALIEQSYYHLVQIVLIKKMLATK
jgi:hypothetical protein